MASRSEKSRPSLAGLNRSIVRLLGKKIDERVSPYIWDMISDMAIISFPPVHDNVLDAFIKGERNPEKLLLLSVAERFGEEKSEIELDGEWPGCTYPRDDVEQSSANDAAAHARPFSAEDAKKASEDFEQFGISDVYNW